MRKLSKKNDLHIISINERFLETAYIDPNFGHDSRYKYKSFFIGDANNYERCGVTKLKCDLIGKKLYKQKYENVEFKCYSELGGYFEIRNAHYHAGKNYVNEFDPLICYRADINDKYNNMQYDFIYEKEEFHDVLVIYAVLEKTDDIHNIYNVYINKNGIDKYCVKNVVSYNYLKDIENTILYVTLNDKNKYSFYLYNYETNETKHLGTQASFHDYEAGLDTCRIAKKVGTSKRSILKNDNVFIHFSADSSVGCIVLMEYLKCSDGLEELKNIFQNDTTKNYSAWFNKNRLEDIDFALYMIFKYNLKGFKIYGYEIKDIAKAIDFGSEIYRFHIRNHFKSEYENIIETVQLLKNKFNVDDVALVQLLTKEYGYFSVDWLTTRMRPYIGEIKITHPEDIKGDTKRKYDDEIQKIFNNIMLDNPDMKKWKSELSLYSLVQMYFPESDYQYRTSWLGRQSFDIFIRNHNLAIEYQGEQHYKAIDIFGGKEGLKATIERDNRKRLLCKEQGVELIEWKYDIPINIYNLRKFISGKGIEIAIG